MQGLGEYVVPDGMPRSIFENKYSRRKPDGTMQTWAERVREVVAGNFLLDPRRLQMGDDRKGAVPWHQAHTEKERTTELAVAGIMPFSGRHLQHGDDAQPDRILELFSNCSTTLFSFQLFLLLLNGSGVGRDYSAACCRVDWDQMPNLRLVLDDSHPDFRAADFGGFLEPLRDARHKYDSESERVRWFTVADSREGWAKVVEVLETAAWQGRHRDKLFVFDFTAVRPQGSPIHGLQNRPASGPVPLMNALARAASIRGAGMKPWKQALFIDHYLAECVVWGGARRSARMAVKTWRDRDAIEFIDIKRGGHLWSANDSLTVDAEFWEQAREPRHTHARRVFEAAVNAAYWDKTGEPGFINVDMLNANLNGADGVTGANCISGDASGYGALHPKTVEMVDNVLSHVRKLRYQFITNPCGEIVLSAWGGLCIIGDVNLSRVRNLDDATDAARLMARFLIRCNLMRSGYAAEVRRTNRIGVSLTGIHEFAWNMFGLTFRDMIYYHDSFMPHKAHAFWRFVDGMRLAVQESAAEFSTLVGLPAPHTATTIKPSGTISKVMDCTEGAHLPPYRYYLRWVMYLATDPDLALLRGRGYPAKDVSHRYSGHWVVGFPTRQPIAALMGDNNVTTADEVTPEEQFRWLRLLETHWLGGPGENNQVSYTLKYDANRVSFTDFMATVLEWQPKVRCCAVMPQSDWRESERVYGYVPEQPLTATDYADLMSHIRPVEREGYDDAALACADGACPIEGDLRRLPAAAD